MTEQCLRCGRVPDDLIHDHPNDHGWTGTSAMHPFIDEGRQRLLRIVASEVHMRGKSRSKGRPPTDEMKRWNKAIASAKAAVEQMFAPIPPEVIAKHDHYFAKKIAERTSLSSEAAPEAQPNFTLTMEKRALVIHGEVFVNDAPSVQAAWADLSEKLEALGITVTRTEA